MQKSINIKLLTTNDHDNLVYIVLKMMGFIS